MAFDKPVAFIQCVEVTAQCVSMSSSQKKKKLPLQSHEPPIQSYVKGIQAARQKEAERQNDRPCVMVPLDKQIPQMKASRNTIIRCHNAITQQNDSKIETPANGKIKVLTDLIE